MTRANAAAVLLRSPNGDRIDAGRQVDTALTERVISQYRTSNPLVSSREIYPALRNWHVTLANADVKYAHIAGSIGLEAALGAPQQKNRRALLSQTRRLLGDCGMEQVQLPSRNLIRRNRLLGVAGLLATRSMNSREYSLQLHSTLSQLESARSFADAEADYAGLAVLSDAVMEQTVLCLLQEPEQGIVAVPSFLRQDETDWREDGKKYSWDVTAESNGARIPAGQYRIRSKNSASLEELRAYHEDIVMIPGSSRFDDNPYAGAYHRAAASILAIDSIAIAGYRESLFTMLADHGPSDPALQYLS